MSALARMTTGNWDLTAHLSRSSVSLHDGSFDSRIRRNRPQHSVSFGTACADTRERRRPHQHGGPGGERDLTRMVVTIRVLFASVSETLISRLVEFIARVLLEYQMPIWHRRKKGKKIGGYCSVINILLSSHRNCCGRLHTISCRDQRAY